MQFREYLTKPGVLSPHPRGEFSGLWFSYTLWYVAFRNFLLQHYFGALRSYWPLRYVNTSTIAMFVYLTLKHPCINYKHLPA